MLKVKYCSFERFLLPYAEGVSDFYFQYLKIACHYTYLSNKLSNASRGHKLSSILSYTFIHYVHPLFGMLISANSRTSTQTTDFLGPCCLWKSTPTNFLSLNLPLFGIIKSQTFFILDTQKQKQRRCKISFGNALCAVATCKSRNRHLKSDVRVWE